MNASPAPSDVDLSRCCAIEAWGKARIACRAASVVTGVAGCRHEHLREAAYCPDHQANVGDALCLQCHDHPSDPHDCRMTFKPRPSP